MRGRPLVTSYEYDDQGQVARTVQRSPWTPEDRALMLAWSQYLESLCPGCGLPKESAWHTDGWHVVRPLAECDGCSAKRRHEWEEAGSTGEAPKRVTYTRIVDTREDPPPVMT